MFTSWTPANVGWRWRKLAYSLLAVMSFMGNTINIAEHSICFYSPSNPVKLVLFLSSFCNLENYGGKIFSVLSKATCI
jgi:hypothetical protein